jgi:hypothetical protein
MDSGIHRAGVGTLDGMDVVAENVGPEVARRIAQEVLRLESLLRTQDDAHLGTVSTVDDDPVDHVA